MRKEDFSQAPVKPLEVKKDTTLPELMEAMGRLSFQGRNFSLVYKVWEEMINDAEAIFLGLAGAMVPAGMRKVIVHLIERRLVDCIVSTGANLFHDIHESLGYLHWMGSPHADDQVLKQAGIDRIYDTYAFESEFRLVDDFVAAFAKELDSARPYTTREFLSLLGKKLQLVKKDDGILTTAVGMKVPIYCPALGDSSLGIALANLFEASPAKIVFDIIGDVAEMARIVTDNPTTGVIYIGGGTPKNFIQQAEVTASKSGFEARGHKYAVQISTDQPHWGGLSGCTFEEAQSWGKVSLEAKKASVIVDATIALPIIVTALYKKFGDATLNRPLPAYPFRVE